MNNGSSVCLPLIRDSDQKVYEGLPILPLNLFKSRKSDRSLSLFSLQSFNDMFFYKLIGEPFTDVN